MAAKEGRRTQSTSFSTSLLSSPPSTSTNRIFVLTVEEVSARGELQGMCNQGNEGGKRDGDKENRVLNDYKCVQGGTEALPLVRATLVDLEQVPQNLEPDKCDWYEWGNLPKPLLGQWREW
ncbi:nudix hydrolase 1 [Senna tora]|uniref:Nudix hydrolase 1 n=1 Tax=Senna tora TaxID=362788 RepID=A0A834SIG1_9FABA|nr:nudix hydrolase 1 [Senna tora]